jgi:hypothetical protein
MKARINWTVVWGYAVELIGAAVVYLIFMFLFGPARLARFVQSTADEWNDLFGILFSAALAVWLTFTNLRGSMFGLYLEKMGSAAVYSAAFLTSMAVFFLTTASMICSRTGYGFVSHIALFLLVYSLFNLYSMIKNATDLIGLYSLFMREVEIERNRLAAAPKSRRPVERMGTGNED